MIVSDPLALAALTLLHILVLVYWLGGDLGAFVASHIVSDAKAHPMARLSAARVLADVDMAPRSALVLAFPTGVALLAAKGLALLPDWGLAAAGLFGALWLWLVWALHWRPTAATRALRLMDLGVRWALLAALCLIAAGFGPDWPLYVRLKCLLLAGAILCGLIIRATLAPFAAAMAGLAAGAPSAEDDRAIGRALGAARRLVMAIWALVAAAALVGLWKPV
jgi:hypothetical protein